VLWFAGGAASVPGGPEGSINSFTEMEPSSAEPEQVSVRKRMPLNKLHFIMTNAP